MYQLGYNLVGPYKYRALLSGTRGTQRELRPVCGSMAIGVPLGRVSQHTMCVRVGRVWSVRGGMCSERFREVPGDLSGAGGKEERSGLGQEGAWKSDGCGVGMHGAGVGTRRARAGAGRVQGQSPVSGGGQVSAESWKLFSISQLNYVATTCALACFRASPRAPRASHLQREMRCGARRPRRCT